ncbi:MAG: DUF2079 domain-containing protein [Actinobacteria bacterium]|nr:MAG: DUF2079 domain-containing protein [Actinomycetota bacterium]
MAARLSPAARAARPRRRASRACDQRSVRRHDPDVHPLPLHGRTDRPARDRLGPIPGWRYVPGGQRFQAQAADVTAHDRIAARAVGLIPDDAVVAATNSLAAHLSARRRVLSFPFLEDATWVAADETQPGFADRYAPLATAEQLVWLRRNPEWKLVFEDDGVLVFRRLVT